MHTHTDELADYQYFMKLHSNILILPLSAVPKLFVSAQPKKNFSSKRIKLSNKNRSILSNLISFDFLLNYHEYYYMLRKLLEISNAVK